TGGTGGTSSSGGGTSSAGGGAGGAAGSLYDRLGKAAGIDAAIKQIVTAEVGDTAIGSYFAPNLSPSHQPQPADIIECLDALLGAKAGGPEVYPTKTSSGFQCRNMVEAHATLGINSGTFDKFVMIAGGVLKGAISDDDLATVASVLVGTKGQIVTDKLSTAARPCQAPASCAEAAAGAGGAG
ncbi:MAG TPA: hypothetical protein VNW92_30800, partial [Polyangiaceae bacterium]|nr:hypothetical protein [Polyangiaceae bacterium]